ncbi:hypothetical protein NV379_15760 [Paenibacillus sp. N1-5-1-14]|uniref:YetF domain-containing protein n=1 Tax=Paenibacillus radicibacter TaxID=2972488 RepID=UPI0021591956|nr:YetF domain-containing protein [Paenibacillus radicibacter]MCR8644109.1 hypothetical protein [Paenibacillus radicibacter]
MLEIVRKEKAGGLKVVNELTLILRLVLIGLVVALVVRPISKVEVGKLSVVDFVILVMVAQIGVMAFVEPGRKLTDVLMPLAILAVIRFMLTVKIPARGIPKELPQTVSSVGIPPIEQSGLIRYEGLPLPLILDGKVQDANLEKIGQTRFWLKNQLQEMGAEGFKQVFFCSFDHRGRMYYLDKKRR